MSRPMPTEPMSPERLAEIKARCEWHASGLAPDQPDHVPGAANKMALAAVRDTLAMIAEIERLSARAEAAEADAARLRALLDDIEHPAGCASLAFATPVQDALERKVVETTMALRWQRNHHEVISRGWADSGHFPHVLHGSQDAVNQAELAHEAACAALAEHVAGGGR